VFTIAVNTSFILVKNYKDEQPLGKISEDLETNFFNFSKYSEGIYPRTQRIVSAATGPDKNNYFQIFTSNRDSSFIRQYGYSDLASQSNLELVDNYDLKNYINQIGGVGLKYWVFDMVVDDGNLLVSLVLQPQKLHSCDSYRIISIPIKFNKLMISDANEIWNFGECLSSFPNYPGWHDFQGRIATTDKSIFMTAGLLVASTYQGFYPSPYLSGLLPDLQSELSRDELFGTVIEIDKKSHIKSVFARGFRGPSGITSVSQYGEARIYVMDHGPRGGDELNLLARDKDYGWPNVSYGNKYFDRIPGQSGYIDTKFANHDGYSEPLYYWVPSIAPSQIDTLKIDYPVTSTWKKGDLLISSLKGESLFHLKLSKKGYVQSIEQIPVGARIRDLTVVEGNIFMTTDDGRFIGLSLSKNKISSGAFPPIDAISSARDTHGIQEGMKAFIRHVGVSFDYHYKVYWHKIFQ
jgi:glucose/arabinose dehydrogenase